MAYEDLQNHIPEDDDPYAFNLRLLALNNELETFAQRLNPDYRDELEDGCHGCFCSTDIDSELFTEIIFQAKRTREWLPGSKIPFPCSGRVIATEYVIRGMVRHTVESIDNFPGEAQALIREDSEYEQLLNDSTTEYAIAFEQEYRITSDGGFERDFQLKFLIEDDEVSFDPDEDKADGDEYGGDKEEHTVALDSLKGVFDTADLRLLAGNRNRCPKPLWAAKSAAAVPGPDTCGPFRLAGTATGNGAQSDHPYPTPSSSRIRVL